MVLILFIIATRMLFGCIQKNIMFNEWEKGYIGSSATERVTKKCREQGFSHVVSIF